MLDRTSFRTRAEARIALFEYIVAFNNLKRVSLALGEVSPYDFEQAACRREEA